MRRAAVGLGEKQVFPRVPRLAGVEAGAFWVGQGWCVRKVCHQLMAQIPDGPVGNGPVGTDSGLTQPAVYFDPLKPAEAHAGRSFVAIQFIAKQI
jgi:hypothetical protein